MRPKFNPCPHCEDAFCTGFQRGWQAGNAKEYYNHNQTLGEFREWLAAMLKAQLKTEQSEKEFKKVRDSKRLLCGSAGK